MRSLMGEKRLTAQRGLAHRLGAPPAAAAAGQHRFGSVIKAYATNNRDSPGPSPTPPSQQSSGNPPTTRTAAARAAADNVTPAPRAPTTSTDGAAAAAAGGQRPSSSSPSSSSSSPSAATVTATATATAGAGAGAPASAADLNRSLLAAIAEQFQRESLPWIQDLVVPLLEGPPRPLTDTEPPERLADRDSRFVGVQGVRLHFKMALPGEREGPPAAAAAATSADRRQQGAEAAASTPLKLLSLLAWRPPPSSRAPSPSTATSSPPPPSSSSSSSTRSGSGSGSGSGWPVDPPPHPSPDPDAAPTLLLMHGLNGSTFSWRLLMDDLAAYVSPGTGGCRVVAYDRPPYGLSQRPLSWRREEDNPYTLEGGARLAGGLLDALLGPLPPRATAVAAAATTTAAAAATVAASGGGGGGGGRAVLLGHSAGAAVAVETALKYPDRVCGLVLIAPAISTDSRGFLARADLGQLLRFAWTRALLSADGPGLNYVRRQVLKRKAEVEAGRLGIYVDEREVPREVIDGYLRPLRAQDWDMGTLLVYRSLQVSGAPPPLERLRVPVLVLQGREDRTVPMEAAQAVTEALRRRGPGAVTELVVLERCGHVPMDEQPLEVLAAVTDFLNRHCCGSPADKPPPQQQQWRQPASAAAPPSPPPPSLQQQQAAAASSSSSWGAAYDSEGDSAA